jgi:plastocyanin
MKGRITLLIAIAVAIASVLGMTFSSFPVMLGTQQQLKTADAYGGGPTRTFYLFNAELEQVDETKLGFSGDIYSLQTMVVNKGDTVKVNFFNTEPEADEKHSFTLPAFNVNKVLEGGQSASITFTADQAGLFQYRCTFHQPEMSGELVVLG